MIYVFYLIWALIYMTFGIYGSYAWAGLYFTMEAFIFLVLAYELFYGVLKYKSIINIVISYKIMLLIYNILSILFPIFMDKLNRGYKVSIVIVGVLLLLCLWKKLKHSKKWMIGLKKNMSKILVGLIVTTIASLILQAFQWRREDNQIADKKLSDALNSKVNVVDYEEDKTECQELINLKVDKSVFNEYALRIDENHTSTDKRLDALQKGQQDIIKILIEK